MLFWDDLLGIFVTDLISPSVDIPKGGEFSPSGGGKSITLRRRPQSNPPIPAASSATATSLTSTAVT